MHITRKKLYSMLQKFHEWKCKTCHAGLINIKKRK